MPSRVVPRCASLRAGVALVFASAVPASLRHRRASGVASFPYPACYGGSVWGVPRQDFRADVGPCLFLVSRRVSPPGFLSSTPLLPSSCNPHWYRVPPHSPTPTHFPRFGQHAVRFRSPPLLGPVCLCSGRQW